MKTNRQTVGDHPLFTVPEIVYLAVLRKYGKEEFDIDETYRNAWLDEKKTGFSGVIRLHRNGDKSNFSIFLSKPGDFNPINATRLCTFFAFMKKEKDAMFPCVRFTNFQGDYSDIGPHVFNVNKLIRLISKRIDLFLMREKIILM